LAKPKPKSKPKPKPKLKPKLKPKPKPRTRPDKKPEKLDKRALDHFKKLLLKEREQLFGNVKQIHESSKEMGQNGIQDIGDEAANIYNRQILLTLNENDRFLLKEVDEALDRIKTSTYGICDECGEPIGLKRLEVKPVAKYCVPCKAKMEKGKI
jgi:DnaK suppressor protein